MTDTSKALLTAIAAKREKEKATKEKAKTELAALKKEGSANTVKALSAQVERLMDIVLQLADGGD